MSIVPKEVVGRSAVKVWQSGGVYIGPSRASLEEFADHISQWALEQAITTCEAVHSQLSDEYDINGTAAASWCAASIRVMMKGGERDEN